jgi:hypothetical protein
VIRGLGEEMNQDQLGVVLFQQDYFKMVLILRSGTEDVLVNQLINKFHANIKNIRRISLIS